jgi:hypothetical protein
VDLRFSCLKVPLLPQYHYIDLQQQNLQYSSKDQSGQPKVEKLSKGLLLSFQEIFVAVAADNIAEFCKNFLCKIVFMIDLSRYLIFVLILNIKLMNNNLIKPNRGFYFVFTILFTIDMYTIKFADRMDLKKKKMAFTGSI